MRLIDGDALEKFLSDAEMEAIKRKKHVLAGALNMIQGNVRNFPTIEPESHWISCKERLPEEDGDYLVTFEEGYAEDYGLDLVGIAPYEVDCEGFGIWQEEFDIHTLGSLGSEWVDIHVIAWQPLPKRYREEGVEE